MLWRKNWGFLFTHPERISAGIQYVLWELTNDGHTCYPMKELIPASQEQCWKWKTSSSKNELKTCYVKKKS